MDKRILLVSIALVAILLSGCVTPSLEGQTKRFEKDGFGLNYGEEPGWLDWKEVPFAEIMLKAMLADMGEEPELVLIKDEGGDDSAPDMAFIGLVMTDNESKYSSVLEIPVEELEAGPGVLPGNFSNPEIKRIGSIDWIYLSAEQSDEEAPNMSDMAVTICNDKLVVLLLINGKENAQENRDYFQTIAASADCS